MKRKRSKKKYSEIDILCGFCGNKFFIGVYDPQNNIEKIYCDRCGRKLGEVFYP